MSSETEPGALLGRQEEREAMVASLDADAAIDDPLLEDAMLEIPRHLFVPENLDSVAYQDRPLPVGHGQTTSAPHMVALMTNALHLQRGQRVLEIGVGGGYHASVIAHIVGEEGAVFGLDLEKDLVNLANERAEMLGLRQMKALVGDGARGLPEEAPFDAILVTCAIPAVPQALMDQLKEGGHLLAPMGTTRCDLTLYHKHGDAEPELLGECVFVNAGGELGAGLFDES